MKYIYAFYAKCKMNSSMSSVSTTSVSYISVYTAQAMGIKTQNVECQIPNGTAFQRKTYNFIGVGTNHHIASKALSGTYHKPHTLPNH